MLFKKAYPQEVAQELGYQKEYPTKLGWFVGIIGTFVFGMVFVAVTILVVKFLIKS